MRPATPLLLVYDCSSGKSRAELSGHRNYQSSAVSFILEGHFVVSSSNTPFGERSDKSTTKRLFRYQQEKQEQIFTEVDV